MPLYEVRDLSVYNPADIEAWDVLCKAKRDLPRNTWDKTLRTMDNAVASLQPSVRSRLIWTKCGALMGRQSDQPLEAVDHLWRKAEKVFGPSKFSLMFVGSLLFWRISLRSDQWFTVSQPHPHGAIDHETGEVIKERHYWINNSYRWVKPKGPTVDDLMEKFNKRR